MFDTPFIIPVVAIIAWAVVATMRARHGHPDASWDPAARNQHTPPMFKKMFEKAMAERDEQIDKLRERIQVLEEIVTDTHKSHRLSEEIEKLKDQS